MQNVDLKDLAKSLYERRHTGIIVPYRPHRVTGWMPSQRWCHSKVHRFVRENVGCKTVGGWLVLNWIRRFAAYSVRDSHTQRSMFEAPTAVSAMMAAQTMSLTMSRLSTA